MMNPEPQQTPPNSPERQTSRPSEPPKPPRALVWLGLWASGAILFYTLIWLLWSIGLQSPAALPGQAGFPRIAVCCLLMGLIITNGMRSVRRTERKAPPQVKSGKFLNDAPRFVVAVVLLILLSTVARGKPFSPAWPVLGISLLALAATSSAFFALYRLLPQQPVQADPLDSAAPAISSGGYERVVQWPEPPKTGPGLLPEMDPALQKRLRMTRTNQRTATFQMPMAYRIFLMGFAALWVWACVWTAWTLSTGNMTMSNGGSPAGMSVLCLAASFFGLLMLGGSGPKRLTIDLVDLTYQHTDYKILPYGRTGATCSRLPFVMETAAGRLDEDAQGIAIVDTASQNAEIYWIALIWRDRSKPCYYLGNARKPDEARELMTETARFLRLPVLGRFTSRELQQR